MLFISLTVLSVPGSVLGPQDRVGSRVRTRPHHWRGNTSFPSSALLGGLGDCLSASMSILGQCKWLLALAKKPTCHVSTLTHVSVLGFL